MQPLYYMLALTLAAGGAATPSVPEAPVAPAAAAAAVGVNAAAAAAVATANPAPQLALTMQGAVERALRTHPQVTAGQQGRLAARYGRYSTLGGMLPMVAVSDMQAWSHLNMHNLPAEFLSAATADRLRTLNAASNLLSISAAQPLLGLIGQSQRYRANVADERAADAQLEATRHDLSLEVRRQYLALFQARALGDTARASERALKEQVEDAEEKLKAGALATTDVLRRRSAAAAARQQAIAADAAEEIARAALCERLGLGPGALQLRPLRHGRGEQRRGGLPRHGGHFGRRRGHHLRSAANRSGPDPGPHESGAGPLRLGAGQSQPVARPGPRGLTLKRK